MMYIGRLKQYTIQLKKRWSSLMTTTTHIYIKRGHRKPKSVVANADDDDDDDDDEEKVVV